MNKTCETCQSFNDKRKLFQSDGVCNLEVKRLKPVKKTNTCKYHTERKMKDDTV